jgi:hypothetical protein
VQVGSDGFGQALRVVLSFPLTNLFPGAIITNATLKLRAITQSGAVNSLELHRLTTGFSEDSVTWNQAASGVPWTAGGDFDAAPLDQLNPGGAVNDTPLYFDGTALVAAVQAAFSGGSDARFLVRAATAEGGTGNSISLGANSNADQFYRPMLTLDVVPEPAGGLVALVFAAVVARIRR